ncbi:MAG: TonB-dependent receptor [Cytophagales bacterium]|nr:TonB-dependent receptor [Cytophagales bacterium]
MLKFFYQNLLVFVLAVYTQTGFAQQMQTLKGQIFDAKSQQPLTGVSISAPGRSTGVVTDVDGNFQLPVVLAETIRISYVGYVTEEKKVTAGMLQSGLRLPLSEDELALSEVVVVGSRNAGRTVQETPVPVDVIPLSKVLQANPQADLNAILTYAAPSFQSNRQTGADGSDHIDPATLRGLGPDQVLVLVNGKRRHNTALLNLNGAVGRGSVGTDLNTIPVSAIERVEVLRDGASAQYGSDAIAGVINVVLKEQTGDLEVGLTSGIHKEGDGELLQFTGNYGLKAGKRGFVNLSADVSKRGYTNRMKEFEGKIFEDASGRDITERELKARGLERSDFNMRVGNSESVNASLFLNSGFYLGEKTEFYAFGGANFRRGVSTAFYRLPYQSRTNRYLYTNGFLPEIHSDIQDQSLTVGLRTQLGAWHLDVYNSFGRNRFDFRVENTSNTSLKATSPDAFDAGAYVFLQNVSGLSFSKKYDVLQGLNLAVGSEFRFDQYEIIAGEEASYGTYTNEDALITDPSAQQPATNEKGQSLPGGSQGFSGFSPANAAAADRTNLAFYADAELDVLDNLFFGGALRYEDYSDFGSTLTGKIASRYEIVGGLALRGAVSTGFRAPSLHQISYTSVSTNSIDGELVEVGTFRNDSPAAKALGIPELKEEKSVNYSLGLTFSPKDNIQLSVDAYRIDIDDRIILTGTFGKDEATRQALESVNADKARFFTNAVDTRTQGIDFVASSQWEVGRGNLDATLSANWTKTKVRGEVKTTELLKGKENVYFSRRDRSLIENANPKSKINLTLNYSIEKWGFLLRNVRFGEIKVMHSSKPERDQTYSAKIVTDAAVSYQFTEKLGVSVGANNLLDIYPDKNIKSRQSSGRFVYPRTISQFGANGAYYFARLNIRI